MNVIPLNTHRTNTRPATGDGPTAAELATIEAEMPVLDAEVDLLDVQIALLDRAPNELDARRLRRAHRKVLLARIEVANRTTGAPEVA
ncbi:DUF6284 family protein [Streptomyces sp. DSM 42041]|uniref:DUF6284 family protein n=1 Tax=Streptomyces hazeniae TaxID=3075538 RepID=A0ABU2P1R0_9ACTN|nr:DUF6284 family protein [Streptomyces sp. DSM 42041]MDT0382702.1 DUF6284 family protein [Streptomyces sp. DSM 42041]